MRAPLLYCQRAFNWQLLNNRKANDSIIQLSPEIKSLLLSNGASVFIIYWKRLTHPCSVMICPMPTSYKSCQWFTNLGQFMVLICYYKYKTQLMHLSLEQTITRFIYYNAQITASKPFEMTIIYAFQHLTWELVGFTMQQTQTQKFRTHFDSQFILVSRKPSNYKKKGDGKHLILENVALGFQFEMNSLSLKHQNNLTFNLKKIFIGKASSNSQYIILYILQDILFYFNCFVFANFIMMSYCLYRISCPQPSWQEEGWSFFHTWLFCAGQAVGLLCCVCHRKKNWVQHSF